jgi:hypothetical protein
VTKYLSATTAVLLAASGTPVLAQSNDWSVDVSLYLFAAETDITVGDTTGTLSFSDALENLDFAGMGAVSVTNQQWTFIADLMYFDLGFENDLRGPNFNDLDTDQENTLFTAVALYRVHETPTMILDVGGGFRYFDTETTLTLGGGIAPTQRRSVNDDWTDAILAAHSRFKLSDKWSSMVAADWGGFHSDRETYQFTVTFDYAFTDAWRARLGYRYVNVENDGLQRDFRFEQSGPIVGVSYTF